MKKVCIALQTPDFIKGLEKLDKKTREDIVNKIKELVAKENEHDTALSGGKGPAADYGNTLSNLNKNTFVMKTKLRERFMATIIEDEKSKTYVWFFSGTHEKYNKLIEKKFLADKEKSLVQGYSKQIQEETKGLEKEKTVSQIQTMRHNQHGRKNNFKPN